MAMAPPYRPQQPWTMTCTPNVRTLAPDRHSHAVRIAVRFAACHVNNEQQESGKAAKNPTTVSAFVWQRYDLLTKIPQTITSWFRNFRRRLTCLLPHRIYANHISSLKHKEAKLSNFSACLSHWLACLAGGRNALNVFHYSQLLTLLNSTVNMNYIWRSSPYRAVNTLRLGYKNQSVNAV